jgi:hypothetical protein
VGADWGLLMEVTPLGYLRFVETRRLLTTRLSAETRGTQTITARRWFRRIGELGSFIDIMAR